VGFEISEGEKTDFTVVWTKMTEVGGKGFAAKNRKGCGGSSRKNKKIQIGSAPNGAGVSQSLGGTANGENRGQQRGKAGDRWSGSQKKDNPYSTKKDKKLVTSSGGVAEKRGGGGGKKGTHEKKKKIESCNDPQKTR